MTDPDPTIERALRAVRVPDHRARFWEDLDAALDGDEVISTSDVRRRGRRPSPRWMALAAALALVFGLAALLVRDGPNAPRRVSADQPDGTPVASGPGADEVVRDWLESLAAGRVESAAALVGPRSHKYATALGTTVADMVRESQEGYGAWPDSPDMTTTEIDLGHVGGSDVIIVVISGTWTGEGDFGSRFDAIPVVRNSGAWVVEPWAFPADIDGRLSITSPTPTGRGSLEALGPAGSIAAAAPGRGEFYFSLNDGEVVAVDGVGEDGGVRASWDPPGELPRQTHLIVVAYLDRAGDTITAFAGTFTVV